MLRASDLVCGCVIWSLKSGGALKDGNLVLMVMERGDLASASTLQQDFETSLKIKKTGSVFTVHMPVEARRGRCSTEMVPTWVLGTERRSSGRVLWALRSWVISARP